MAARRHQMFPCANHDERAAQQFLTALRQQLSGWGAPGARAIFEARVAPEVAAREQRPPRDRHDIRRLMTRDPYYQFWSALQRRSQELLWETTLDPVERQLTELIQTYRELGPENPQRLGSLLLDPELPIPRYHTAADIHLQPGGYHTDFCAEDVAAGALYDSALPIYAPGALGPENDALGRMLLAHFRTVDPEARPERILDMGAGIGNSTLPWARAFPAAEVHAIDVGAPCLRYGHGRAESLGVAVHFSQQNAEATSFAAGSFDLVVSHIMLHETSAQALPNILRESFRLLKPGGWCLHMDIPRGGDPFEQFMYEWETYNSNENFSSYMTDADLPALARAAGFSSNSVHMGRIRPFQGADDTLYSANAPGYPVLVASKPAVGKSVAA